VEKCSCTPLLARNAALINVIIVIHMDPVAQPAQNLGKGIIDFRLATVFCMGYRLSKHKMTRYYKNLGRGWPLSSYPD